MQHSLSNLKSTSLTIIIHDQHWHSHRLNGFFTVGFALYQMETLSCALFSHINFTSFQKRVFHSQLKNTSYNHLSFVFKYVLNIDLMDIKELFHM